jgi:CRISPR/Cas system Type II protein with McrA/HNH and RuvC-like nuclease domain
MQYPKNLEFLRENGNMGSDGTDSNDSQEDCYKQEEGADKKNEISLHAKRLKNLRRDYRKVKLAPFASEAVEEV